MLKSRFDLYPGCARPCQARVWLNVGVQNPNPLLKKAGLWPAFVPTSRRAFNINIDINIRRPILSAWVEFSLRRAKRVRGVLGSRADPVPGRARPCQAVPGRAKPPQAVPGLPRPCEASPGRATPFKVYFNPQGYPFQQNRVSRLAPKPHF